MGHAELSHRAERDLKALPPGRVRARIITALREQLTAVPRAQNLDVKAIVGATPWLRLRVGDWRIIFRPLTEAELEALRKRRPLGLDLRSGYLIDRIVNRRDLGQAVSKLE